MDASAVVGPSYYETWCYVCSCGGALDVESVVSSMAVAGSSGVGVAAV